MATSAGPLAFNLPIVEGDGRPTPAFQRQWLSVISGEGVIPPNTYVRAGIANGWASATGTASRTAFATYAAPTMAASYDQAQVQALAAHVQILSQHLKAALDDLKTLRAFNT